MKAIPWKRIQKVISQQLFPLFNFKLNNDQRPSRNVIVTVKLQEKKQMKILFKTTQKL